MTPRCWLCDAEGDVVGHVMSAASAVPIRTEVHWPAPGGDHDHAVTPPTPRELTDAGYRVFTRMLEDRPT